MGTPFQRCFLLVLALVWGLGQARAVRAQTLYSVNAVGFVNLAVDRQGLICTPLDAATNSAAGLFPFAPEGSRLVKFQPATGDFRTNTLVAGQWLEPDMQLPPGEAYFFLPGTGINIPSGRPMPLESSVSLSVEATGTGPLTYLWRKRGLPLTDATNAVLTLDGLLPAHVGPYDVTISNAAGSLTSSVVNVVVNSTLPVTNATPVVIPLTWSPFELGARVEGSSNLVQWTAQLTTHVELTTNSISFLPPAGTTWQYYRAVLVEAPVLNERLEDISVMAGHDAQLHVVASGPAPLDYRWARNGVLLAGATNSSLLLTNLMPSNAGTYVVTISSGAWTIASSALVTVHSNAPPTVSFAGSSVTVPEDSGAQTLAAFATFSAGPTNQPGQSVTNITVTNNNPSLFSSPPALTLDGTLTFTPATNATGSATVTVILEDDGGTLGGGINRSTNQFTITLTAINDPPTITFATNQLVVLEDAGPQSRPGFALLTAGPPQESGQVLTIVSVTNSNPVLFSSQPAITLNGMLTFTSAANAHGSATVTLIVSDNGGTSAGGINRATNTFTLTVLPVNDAPRFTQSLRYFTTNTAVLAWGGNESGQSTVPPAAHTGVTAVAAGDAHSLALKQDASIVAWGEALLGQTEVPVSVQGRATAIAAGAYHSLALKSDGGVVAWGHNGVGQTNVPAAAQSGVTAIAAGGFHTLALRSNGSVVAWGDNLFGQITVPVAAQTGVMAIAAGRFHSLAVKSNGVVIAWGDNSVGQATVPVGAAGITNVAAGQGHNLALKNDGSVLAWGWNPNGQTNLPAQVQSGVVAISAGGTHSLALLNSGMAIAWGDNAAGQTTVPAGALTGVTALATGFEHSLAVVRLVTENPGISVAGDSGPCSRPGVAVVIAAGPVNESGQAVSFLVTNDNPSLFSDQPSLSRDGTLTFSPAPGVSGTAIVSIAARDDGGTSDGGKDTSAAQTFTLTVLPLRIVTPAASQTVMAGNTVTLSVAAVNATGYQWQFNGASLAGADLPTLVIPNATVTHRGAYTVVVTSAEGCITNGPAELRVLIPQRLQTPVSLGAGRYQLRFGNHDGSPLAAEDAGTFEVYGSTSLTGTNWVRITNGISLNGGLLQVEVIPADGLPSRFYRVLQR